MTGSRAADRQGGRPVGLEEGENVVSSEYRSGPLDLKGKKAVVVGLGRSGVSAARLLVRLEAQVWATDLRSREELGEEEAALSGLPVRFAFGGHPPSVFEEAEVVVTSPGVPSAALRKFGRRIIGEVELAFRCLPVPWAAVTGTNGKSTTTTLIGEMFRSWGKEVFVGGNLGTPACEAVLSGTSYDWAVVELSSFQLETIETFRPEIAALLNVTPNHLDRYADFSEYVNAKLAIFSNQERDDWAVLNMDDPVSRAQAGKVPSRVAGFGRGTRPERGVWLEGDRVMSNLDSEEAVVRRSDVMLRGDHNIENVLAAVAVAQAAGCPAGAVRDALGRFAGLEHRLETVRESRGVLFVNDAKSTTPSATASAIASFEAPVVLIAGGQDKGSDFEALRSQITGKVRAVVAIGQARAGLRRAWEGTVPFHESDSLKGALDRAAALARPGDAVLFSPGCPSFDMFRNFEDRGRQFKALVAGLS